MKQIKKNLSQKINSIEKRLVRYEKHFIYRFFTHKITIAEWELHTFGLIMFVIGAGLSAYLTISRILIPTSDAAPIVKEWNFSNQAEYSISNTDKVEFAGNSVRLKLQQYQVDSNTKALYHFDENTGSTTNDSSTNANHANLVGVGWEDGRMNTALDLNGASYAQVNHSSSLALTDTMTIEAQVKMEDIPNSTKSGRLGILDKGDYKLYVDKKTGKVVYELSPHTTKSWVLEGGHDRNGSWDLAGKTNVGASAKIGDKIFVGLGDVTNDAEVWEWDTASNSWRMIGGDGLNSSWLEGNYEKIHTLFSYNNILYAGLGTGTGDAEVWKWNGTGWSMIGGDGVNASWVIGKYESVLSLTVHNDNLIAGLGVTASDADVWRLPLSGGSWVQIGGSTMGFGAGYEGVYALTSDGTNLYAALGNSANDADVWRWNGSTWLKIGGDSINSGWATNYDYVYSLIYAGGKLYAGLGVTATEAEVWEWNGTIWTKIGGDGVNTSWITDHEIIYSMYATDTNIYVGLGLSNNDAEVWTRSLSGTNWTKIGGDGVGGSFSGYAFVETIIEHDGKLYAGVRGPSFGGEFWQYNGTTWTMIGGRLINESWGYYSVEMIMSTYSDGSNLYAGMGNSAGDAQVWKYDGLRWEFIGGQGIRSSWARDTFENVNAIISYNGKIYVGIGSSANDAEVWEYNGSSWRIVGGDGLGWGANYDDAFALTVFNNKLYAGLGNTAGEAELWQWDGTNWQKIGGDNMGWNTTNYERVSSLYATETHLYAGLGLSAGDAEVWRWDGTTWVLIGGDGLNSSWANSVFEQVTSLIEYKNQLFASLGNSAGDGEIWKWNGSVWQKIGGDGVGWADATYEISYDMAVYNGKLYVGLGTTAGDGEVWEYDGVNWVQVGGDGLGWGVNIIETVSSLSVFNGKLYVGLGASAVADAQIWAYGNNSILKSETQISNSNWQHIGATYDGEQMKIYINGVLDATKDVEHTISDNSLDLLLGSLYGSYSKTFNNGGFIGNIDELRISSDVKTSFNVKPFSDQSEIVELKDALYTLGVNSWDSYGIDTLYQDNIKFRLSDDGGVSWKYYNGSAWINSVNLNQSNTVAEVNTNISSFPKGLGGIKWQAIMQGDGEEQISLEKISLGLTTDDVKPIDNATSIVLENSLNEGWTKEEGVISWQEGEDDAVGIGIYGYCISLDEADPDSSNLLDPETNAGKLNLIDDGVALDSCPYIVTGTQVNLADISGLVLNSSKEYYFSIKAVDGAGNVFAGPTETYQDLISFLYDDTAPRNVAYLNVPNTSFGSITDMFFAWPSSGSGSSEDSDSGVLGWQYSINSTTDWKGSVTIPGGSATYLPKEGSNYTYNLTLSDEQFILIGNNTVYLRTIDKAGNASTHVSAVISYGGPAPKFPAEAQITITPQTNTANEFSVSWTAAIAQDIVGEANSIKSYYYMINSNPPASLSTLQNNPGLYVPIAQNSIPQGQLKGSIKGGNTIHVVAVDQFDNYSPSNFLMANYTLNSNLPDPPLDLSVNDASNKAKELWRASLTWQEPIYKGTGQLTYKIQRSQNSNTWTDIGTTTGVSYTDIVPSSAQYYYRVGAYDTTNDSQTNPTFSQSVTIIPKGRFDKPADLTSGPVVVDITTTRATIRWTTNRESDTRIAYGLESGKYFTEEQTISLQTLDHEISLNGLKAGTTYYYVAKWNDEDGNSGLSVEKTFTTNPPPVVKSVDVSNIGLNSALIKFRVVDAITVDIKYGPSTNFGALEKVLTSTSDSTYTVLLNGLNDGTTYYYLLTLYDIENETYESNVVMNFTTLARPRASNIRIEEIRGVAQPTVKVAWTTNSETTSELSYFPENEATNAKTITLDDSFRKEHEITIENLLAKTNYQLQIKGRDRYNNSVFADLSSFTTATDTRPPKISNLTVKSSISTSRARSGGSNMVQIFVSWETDEPATSQVEYGEGVGSTYAFKTNVDDKLKNKHVVIISDLVASKVYHLRAVAIDSSGNQVESADNVTITPKAQDSPIDLVIMSLTNVFGFVRIK